MKSAIEKYLEATDRFLVDLSPEDIQSMCVGGTKTELGEFFDIVKKYLFHGKEINKMDLVHEAGDVLFYYFRVSEWEDYVLDYNIAMTPQRAWKGYTRDRAPFADVVSMLCLMRWWNFDLEFILDENIKKLEKRFG